MRELNSLVPTKAALCNRKEDTLPLKAPTVPGSIGFCLDRLGLTGERGSGCGETLNSSIYRRLVTMTVEIPQTMKWRKLERADGKRRETRPTGFAVHFHILPILAEQQFLNSDSFLVSSTNCALRLFLGMEYHSGHHIRSASSYFPPFLNLFIFVIILMSLLWYVT